MVILFQMRWILFIAICVTCTLARRYGREDLTTETTSSYFPTSNASTTTEPLSSSSLRTVDNATTSTILPCPDGPSMDNCVEIETWQFVMFYGAWLVLILAGFALAGAEIWQEVEKYRYEKEEEAAKPEIMLIQVKNDEYYRRLLNDRNADQLQNKVTESATGTTSFAAVSALTTKDVTDMNISNLGDVKDANEEKDGKEATTQATTQATQGSGETVKNKDDKQSKNSEKKTSTDAKKASSGDVKAKEPTDKELKKGKDDATAKNKDEKPSKESEKKASTNEKQQKPSSEKPKGDAKPAESKEKMQSSKASVTKAGKAKMDEKASIYVADVPAKK
ncbi:hypothetical protein AAVH_06131 [Aphelenchoides avenae]|nr:hypothetical protein AAVH_06131 [Aphelenchus avenae]